MLTILFLTTLTLCVSVAHAAMMRDYNYVRLVHLSNFQEFEDRYLNSDRTVKENIFLGVATPDCWALMSSPAFEGAARYAHNLHAVTVPAETFPFRLNDCAELFFYRGGDPLDGPRDRTTDFRDYELTRWSADHMRVDSLTFYNGFDYPITVYWHEEALEPINQGTIQPGQSMTISAFLGHIFTANALSDDVPDHEPHAVEQFNGPAFSRIVDYMSVEGNSYTFSPHNRLETCEITDQSKQQTFVEQEVSCEDMLLRFLEYSHGAWHVKRLGLNYVQPKIVSSYSELGFEHRKLPQSTYSWLKSWYEREQQRIEGSESSAGPCMNQHVAPSLITHLTPNEKNRLERELRPILEAWYGDKLFLTSIYGIRKYTNGSILRMHVDTCTTHVVSAIINVDQDVEEDWPLLILDHEDNEHNLIMQPGDMVLYESAKALHGRPTPMKGNHYDNIFIHFQPVQGWDYDWL